MRRCRLRWIQGARIAGARTIIAVDPVPFKLEKALEVGATHTAPSLLDAQFMLPELTKGRNADVVILTPGVLKGELIGSACALGSKDARIVVTAIAPFDQTEVQLNLFNLAMYNQALLGTVFGSASPRVQVPNCSTSTRTASSRSTRSSPRSTPWTRCSRGTRTRLPGTIIRGVVAFDQ